VNGGKNMSGISTISQAQGFNQQLYDNLIQQARAENVDTGSVNTMLLNAVNSGKSFDQALALVQSDLPNLPTPTGAAFALLKDWPALPSPGALIMSVTTQYAAEQRQRNQELMWKETEAIAQSMKDQAREMRNAAVTQLVLGCVSGAVQIGMGVMQMGMGAAAAKNATAAANKAAEAAGGAGTPAGSKAFSEAFTSAMMTANMNIGAAGQIGGGFGRMIDAGGQYVGTQMQARVKEMEAGQETMRAMRDAIKNLDESLRELIRKSLAAQNDLQTSTNQARPRILA
jgi:hypothetical protein